MLERSIIYITLNARQTLWFIIFLIVVIIILISMIVYTDACGRIYLNYRINQANTNSLKFGRKR